MDSYFEDIDKGLQPTTTITLPLKTTFTPAPGCSSSWTYVQLTFTLTSFSIDGGLVQEFKDSLPDRDCFPSGHLIHWDIGTAQVYSPGFCPVGYTVDAASVEGTTTTEICCLENFEFVPEASGCGSSFPNGTITEVYSIVKRKDRTRTTVTGPLPMLAEPITVAHDQGDLSRFSSQPSTTPGILATSIYPTSTGPSYSPSYSLSCSFSEDDSSMTTAQKAGLGVGVGGACLFIIASFIGLILRGYRTRQTICSQHGTDMFKKGDNAVDALVTTVFCVGVTGMHHSGIGGGGFMLNRAPNGTFEFVDFREKAPAAAFQDMYNDKVNASIYGGLASGVPGEVRGLEYLHKNYGVLPWSTILQPAIKTAREGFPVTKELVSSMEFAVGNGEDFLSKNATWALDFAPNGTRLGLGDIMTRRRYASTLEVIADQGPGAFYTGPIAETMVKAIEAANGTMTLHDLESYSVALRDISQIDYRGIKVTSTTAPSSGIVALSVLKVLDTYDEFFSPNNVNLSTHRMDEAIRFGYGERTNLGDPSFVEGMGQYQADMLEGSTAEAIRGKISDAHTLNVSAYNPEGIESLDTQVLLFQQFFQILPRRLLTELSPGTSHIVAADHSGLAISVTTTINLLFGSQVMIPETGIIMNNEMNGIKTLNSYWVQFSG